MEKLGALTRKEALARGAGFYESPRPCKRCGTFMRYSKTAQCRACHAEWSAKYAKENRLIINARSRERWLSNENRKARQREWQSNNRDKCRRACRTWAANNPENNLERVNRRRALKLKACPKWVNRRELRSIYDEARRISASTGTQYHVDHIVPLNHPLVCGLHVPWNLRLLTAEENIRKGNTFMLESV